MTCCRDRRARPAGQLARFYSNQASFRPTTESAVGEGARSPGDLLRLGRAAGRAGFDVFLFPAVYSYFPLLSRTPCAVVFHDTIAERFPELVFPTRRNRIFWNAKVALAKRQAKRAVTVSRASARDLELRLGVPAERIDVVSEAADPQFRPLDDPARLAAARSRVGCQGGEPLLLAVGGLSPHKNLRRLLAAMPAVFERHPAARLAIVGDTSGKGFFDEADALQRAVREQPLLSERVCFTGFVSDEDLVALYNAATLLVFPSLWEGFGLPAIEAMACGLPVAASARGSLPEIVADAGRYFDPESVDEMTRVIDELLALNAADATHGLEGLRARGLALAASYSWPRAAAELEESLRRCARGDGARLGAPDSQAQAAR
jgi:glycosyltransferase involved in cell wall biosynthesis